VVKGLHYGQRKLILSEIEFLTAVSERSSGSTLPILVVYAGAANGSHLPFLFMLFPNVRFVLIDPAPFCDAVCRIADQLTGPILEIVEGCCTDELCMRLKREHSASFRVVLVSDIRSGVPCRSTNREHTAMIMRDNAWQKEWCRYLDAECAMLKFHPPYPKATDPNSPKFEPDDDTPPSITYLDGVLLWGVWAPKSSSEVRLVVKGPFDAPKERVYDATEFEEQCYHHNTSGRHQRDVDAERLILRRYLQLTNTFPDELVLSSKLSDALGFPKFLPLTLTEDEARIVSLLYLSKVSTDIDDLYPVLKYVTAQEMCTAVAKRCGIATDPNLNPSTSFPDVPEYFWYRVANSRNLGETYSFPPIIKVRNEQRGPSQPHQTKQKHNTKRPREPTL
jgi:cap2 methyltransferase